MSKQVFKKSFAGKELIVEVGQIAKQANASVLVRFGETVILTAVTNKMQVGQTDFFPLMVIYQERLYAAGKIPGGFLRREGRPSEHETLTSRLIDRPLRPLFPDGFYNDVQIVNTVLSSDPNYPPEMAALFGSSLALMLSDLPFEGPVSGVHVGLIDNQFVVNESQETLVASQIDLTVAGTKKAINMVEAGAKEVSEETMLEAILLGHSIIKELNDFQLEIVKQVGKEHGNYAIYQVDEVLEKEVLSFNGEALRKAVSIHEKQARYDAIDLHVSQALEHFGTRGFFKDVDGVKVFDKEHQTTYLKAVKNILDSVVKKEVRRLITKDKVRPDGRRYDEIRPLSSEINLLPRTHGSALFTRGQTQSIGVVTLGSLGENQIIDDIRLEDSKRFMLHYNFPPYSVGETGRYGSPGRREIGHGALGERALLQVLPSETDFPYAIRVVSEITESNGSSSMATVCSGTLALMAAGVPIKAPVAGIAMGLIMEGDDYTILSDIQGMEDHEGDMDFKVAGTKEGITALQMDIKISGITENILKEALNQAKKGRLHILDHMATTISKVADDVSVYAPKVQIMYINPDKIRDVIGAGGKIITQIIEDNNQVKIDIEQDGRVFIMHQDRIWVKRAAERIETLVKEAKIGEIYEAKVVRIEAFGAFAELWSGTDGLVHISQLDHKRVEKVEDVVKLGDIILVKVIGVDDKGRIKLSRKDAISK